jgi:hypothetical protein
MPKLITNIVFTKNRPLQLDAYLASLYAHFPQKDIQTFIFYKPELFASEYECVFNDFADCTVIREADFHDDFLKLLDGVETEYILFGTDDVVYYDSVGMDVIRETFRQYSSDILGFSLRLSPDTLKADGDRISECQIAGENILKVNWKKASNHTARYPFELNSTIYRTELVKEIISRVAEERPLLKKIFPKDSRRVRFLKSVISMKDFLLSLETFRKPNTLEAYACRWCKNHKSTLPGFFYFQKLCASAIQVNIVNTEVDNPIFGDNEHTVEVLNSKYRDGYRLDIEAIRNNKPHTTHAGQEYFKLVKGGQTNKVCC